MQSLAGRSSSTLLKFHHLPFRQATLKTLLVWFLPLSAQIHFLFGAESEVFSLLHPTSNPLNLLLVVLAAEDTHGLAPRLDINPRVPASNIPDHVADISFRAGDVFRPLRPRCETPLHELQDAQDLRTRRHLAVHQVQRISHLGFDPARKRMARDRRLRGRRAAIRISEDPPIAPAELLAQVRGVQDVEVVLPFSPDIGSESRRLGIGVGAVLRRGRRVLALEHDPHPLRRDDVHLVLGLPLAPGRGGPAEEVCQFAAAREVLAVVVDGDADGVAGAEDAPVVLVELEEGRAAEGAEVGEVRVVPGGRSARELSVVAGCGWAYSRHCSQRMWFPCKRTRGLSSSDLQITQRRSSSARSRVSTCMASRSSRKTVLTGNSSWSIVRACVATVVWSAAGREWLAQVHVEGG